MSQISEQRREQIVQTARRIVDEHGPNRLTAEAITQEVGVSRPLLYHYFTNMSDLLSAVIDIYAQEFEGYLQEWEHGNQTVDTSDTAAWTSSFIEALRPSLIDSCPLLKGTTPQETPAAYPHFLGRCANIVADHLLNAHEEALKPLSAADDPRKAIHFIVFGMAGLARSLPDTDNDAMASIMSPLWASETPMSEPPQAKPDEGGTARRGFLDWIFN